MLAGRGRLAGFLCMWLGDSDTVFGTQFSQRNASLGLWRLAAPAVPAAPASAALGDSAPGRGAYAEAPAEGVSGDEAEGSLRGRRRSGALAVEETGSGRD